MADMISDTSPEVERWMLQRQRELTTAQRVEQVFGMIGFMLGIEEAVLRHYFPNASPAKLRYLLAKKRYGQETADLVFGGVEN
jgi:hypothetical protein